MTRQYTNVTQGMYVSNKPMKIAAQPNVTWIIELRPNGNVRRYWRYRARTAVITYQTDVTPSGSLAEDKAKFTRWNEFVRRGEHPNPKVKKDTHAKTFLEFAEAWMDEYLELHSKNPKNRQQWRNTLRDYVYPHIGQMTLSSITTDDVIKCIRPIWTDKNETANRVLQRIHKIMNVAIVQKLAKAPNPATYEGNIDQLLPRVRLSQRVQHHPSLHPVHIPDLFALLRKDQSKASLCLQLIIMTASRKGEIRLAQWKEIQTTPDHDFRVWYIPPERMKMKELHKIPMTNRLEQVVAEIAELYSDSPFLLPSPQKADRAISDAMIDKKLEQLKGLRPDYRNQDERLEDRSKWTVHGFRATFRSWASKGKRASFEAIEKQIAHKLDGMAAIYERGDFIEDRYDLLTQWHDYCWSAIDE